MTRALDGQVALVTGGGTGIGAAITAELADLGAQVMIVQRTEAEAKDALERLTHDGRTLSGFGADLSTAAGCVSTIDAAWDRHHRIDILVNNAAVTGDPALTEFLSGSDDLLDAVIDTNLKSAYRCARGAARRMAEQGSGVIVNISSVGARRPQRRAVAYCAAKAGLDGLTRGLAVELAEFGIRVVGVAPGDIALDPPSNEPGLVNETPLGRRGHPSDAAAVVAFLCTSRASFITGETILVDGGLVAGAGAR